MSERRREGDRLLKAAIQLELVSLGLTAANLAHQADTGGMALASSAVSALFVKESGDIDREVTQKERQEFDRLLNRVLPLPGIRPASPPEQPKPSRTRNVVGVVGRAAGVLVAAKVGSEIPPLLNAGLCAALPTTVFLAQCRNNIRNRL